MQADIHAHDRPADHVGSSPMAEGPAFSTRLSREMHALATREAERRGVSTAQIIRDAVAFYLGWINGQEAGKRPDELANAAEIARLLEGSDEP